MLNGFRNVDVKFKFYSVPEFLQVENQRHMVILGGFYVWDYCQALVPSPVRSPRPNPKPV